MKDGGQLQKHYRQAVAAFELKNVSKEGYKRRSWKKTCDDLGKEQALGMLKRGTLKWRKCPQDTKYMEFAVHAEEYKQEATKIRNTRLKASSSKATKEDTLADYENLTLDDIKAEGNWGWKWWEKRMMLHPWIWTQTSRNSLAPTKTRATKIQKTTQRMRRNITGS